jgi:hypothetical protein
MEVPLNFELAVYLSWLLPLLALFGLIWLRPDLWHSYRPVVLAHPRREALLALAASVVVVAISVASDPLLKAWKREPGIGPWVFLGQLALVYSPLFALMVWRREGLETVFIRVEKLPSKIVLGVLLALAASYLFLWVRGQASQFDAFVHTLGRGGPAAMVQTFMEGFAVGFLLYRVGAWLGIARTSLLVATLFMAAHLPNYTQGTYHLPAATALAMIAAHAGIGVFVVASIWRTQDIIVVGVLHWFINAASSFTSV